MSVAYFKCLCKSSDKQRAAELRSDGVVVRDIRRNIEWRREAKQYGLRLPIIVTNGKAYEL